MLFVLMYYSSIRPALQNPTKVKKEYMIMSVGVMLIAALLLRLGMATAIVGHRTDMSCFRAWADMAYKGGLNQFYFSKDFHDYPPGYMYVLWLLGWVKNAANLDYDSDMFVMLIKLPAILCDVLTGYVIYRIVKKYSSHALAVGVAVLFLFNPAVIVNSSVWGQVDSVFTLFLVLSIYFIIDKKFILSCMLFVIGALIKPQMVMFGPVFLLAMIKMIIDGKDNLKQVFIKIGLAAAGCAVLVFFAVLPFVRNFDFSPIVDQYIKTINSYPYGSVNAYNMLWLFRGGWENAALVPGSEGNIQNPLMFLTFGTWSSILIAAVMVFAVWFYIKHKGKMDLFLLAAFIIMGIFTLAGRMHERYVYPAIALLACGFAYKKDLRILWLFFAISILQFINTATVLYQDVVLEVSIPPKGALAPVVAVLLIAVFVWMFRICMNGTRASITEVEPRDIKHGKKSNKTQNTLKASRKLEGTDKYMFKREVLTGPPKVFSMVRMDYLIMTAVTVLYAAVSLVNLGDMSAPESYWRSDVDKGFAVEFDDLTYVSEITWFTGDYEGNFGESYADVTVIGGEQQDDTGAIINDTNKFELNFESVFAWHKHSLERYAKTIRFDIRDKHNIIRLNEIVFTDGQGNVIKPYAVYTPDGKKITTLNDEQQLYPKEISYKNSTYFDEIYHARTAYEFINKLYPYETTHPPLGKVIMSWGIMLFGMNPFGWRVMGTLFGIFMLPLIYIFAKKLFGRTKISAIAIALFAVDFMHFAQTRIATIDVYITFFIILMYYFMYRYYTMNFYRDGFYKTLIPLGLSGVFMGLGIASKWTGAYAGIGLAILLFVSLGKRWYEHYRVMKNPVSTYDKRVEVKPFVKYCSLTLAACLIFFVAVPAAIYVASYKPFTDGWITHETQALKQWPSAQYPDMTNQARTLYRPQPSPPKPTHPPELPIVDETTMQRLPNADMRIILNNQESMLNYHSTLVAQHGFSSPWYEWPLIIRPIWYFSGEKIENTRSSIAAFGNPLIWWAGLAAFLAMIWIGIRRRDKNALFLTIGYLAQYMPWMAVTRVTFIYHYFLCVPFLVLMICYVADYLLQRYSGGDELLKGRRIERNIWIYVAFCVLLFVVFLPVLSGTRVSDNYLESLKWFKNWTF